MFHTLQRAVTLILLHTCMEGLCPTTMIAFWVYWALLQNNWRVKIWGCFWLDCSFHTFVSFAINTSKGDQENDKKRKISMWDKIWALTHKLSSKAISHTLSNHISCTVFHHRFKSLGHCSLTCLEVMLVSKPTKY